CHDRHLLVGLGALIFGGEEDDQIVRVRAREASPRPGRIEVAGVEAKKPIAPRNAVANRLGRGVGLQLIKEPDGLAGGEADAVGFRSTFVELLKNRKRYDDDVAGGEIIDCVWRRHQNTRVDDIHLYACGTPIVHERSLSARLAGDGGSGWGCGWRRG